MQIVQDIEPNTVVSTLTFKGRKPVSANTYQIDPNRPYIVKGLLLAGQVGMIAGEPNLGKSAITSCIAAHVAKGLDMGEMKVQRAGVLYGAAEDPEGILERTYPFMHAAPDGAATLDVLDVVPDMTNDREVRDFISYAQAFKAQQDCDDLLIVLDTLNLSIGDADENSARDMSSVLRNAHLIAQSTGAHVLFIHHVGTGDKGRPRGSSAMTGNLDTLLTLEKAQDDHGDIVLLVPKKQKRVKKGPSLAFRIEPFEVDLDDDGEVFTVPKAVPLNGDDTLTIAPMPLKERSSKPTASDKRISEVLQLLKRMSAHDPVKWHDRKAISENVGGPFNEIRENKETLRKAVSRALEALEKAGSVAKGNGSVYRYNIATPASQIASDSEGLTGR